MILIIDNYDSFTYNLYHLFSASCKYNIVVKRNNEITTQQIKELSPKALILSPGPCSPNEAGICLEVVRVFSGIIPILGICLGHQTIGQAFGAKIIRNYPPFHGKIDDIYITDCKVKTILSGITSPFHATRYHSLVIDPETLSKDFIITSHTKDNVIMSIAHKFMPVHGLQFHPESIGTQYGDVMAKNFLEICGL
jgi:anthranilate synthase/aminodeoxychorismate synthase-like glutamine amidotransferase